MITILYYILSVAASQSQSQSRCETIGPRLDGTYVTICGGHVTRVTDKVPTTAYTFLKPESR